MFQLFYQSALQYTWYNRFNIVTVEVCTQLSKLAIYLCLVVLEIVEEIHALQKHIPVFDQELNATPFTY